MRHALLLAALSATSLALPACSDDESSVPGPTTTTSTTPDGGSGGSDMGGSGGSTAMGGTGGTGGSGGTGAVPLDLVYYDVNQVLATGQSLSVGAVGSPALSVTQPYENLMFAGGVAATTDLTSFAPLVEGVNPPVETMSSAFANFVTAMAQSEVLLYQPEDEQTHDLLVTLHGVGGTPYSGLAQGTQPYANGMAQLAAADTVCEAATQSHVVRAVTTVHGESDHVSGNTAYEANLVEWQADYEADVQAVTLQAEPVPLFQTQMSSWTRYGQAQSIIPSAQLAASENNPASIILVGPKYAIEYATDGVHLTNAGYQHMGEYYAKAYRRAVLEGQPWVPLSPTTISRDGAEIEVVFAVPEPPLVLDTTLVSDPGHYGFEYFDASGAPPAIASVALSGDDSVTITLASVPTGTGQRLRYAFTGTPGALAGATSGPRGNLRDSDAIVSPHGFPLYNWCVHFDKPIP